MGMMKELWTEMGEPDLDKPPMRCPTCNRVANYNYGLRFWSGSGRTPVLCYWFFCSDLCLRKFKKLNGKTIKIEFELSIPKKNGK